MEALFDGSISVDEFILKYQNITFVEGDEVLISQYAAKRLKSPDWYILTVFLELKGVLPIPNAATIIDVNRHYDIQKIVNN